MVKAELLKAQSGRFIRKPAATASISDDLRAGAIAFDTRNLSGGATINEIG